VPFANTCLSLARAPGGGSATISGSAVNSSYSCWTAGADGLLSITYRTPATLPDTGTDLLYVRNSATASSSSASSVHGYSFGRLASVSLTPAPIAPTGTLAARKSVTLTLVPRDATGAPVAGATVYLRLQQASGAIAWINKAADVPDGTKLSGTFTPFLTHTSTRMTITYRTPSTLPATGVDVVQAHIDPATTVGSAASSYAFGP